MTYCNGTQMTESQDHGIKTLSMSGHRISFSSASIHN